MNRYTKNIVEYPITPEVPNVSYAQQLYIHVPLASTFNKGIAQYDSEHFAVTSGVVSINAKTLDRFTNIVHVDSLPDLADANPNLLYCLHKDIITLWICDAEKANWIRVDEAINIVTDKAQILDNSRVYILTKDSAGLIAGVYLYNGGIYTRLLAGKDLEQINKSIANVASDLILKEAKLAKDIADVAKDLSDTEAKLAKDIKDIKDSVDGAVKTAGSASLAAADAVKKAGDAEKTADDAKTIAGEAKTAAETAAADAAAALEKAGNITGGLILKGSISDIEKLPEPSAETLGWLYNVNDAFVTTDEFVEGAGISYKAGENIAIVEPETGVYKYDVFSGIVDLTPLENEINDLKEQVGNLLYKAITITSFTNSVGTAEIGSTVTSANLSWKFSKTPTSVTLDGKAKDITSTGESLTDLSLTSSKTWTLKATDERNHTATATTSISFVNRVYYGVASAPTTYNSEFVKSLQNKPLRGNKVTSFTVTAGEGQFIYYCIPKGFGTAAFNIGGFDGGFRLVATISFTNNSKYTEDYYIYRSDNANLGLTTVSVK